MKNVNRYDCGNGEGMFDNKTGYWVTHEDYKLLLDKYEKLALTIPDVVHQREQFKSMVFDMANKMASAGLGDEAVSMHRVHNRL